jgi:hypothetical protein
MEAKAAKNSAHNRHPILTALIPVVEALGKTFGRYTEVVLHDISDPEHSIIAIANGEVTGRKVRGPMTEVGLRMIKESQGAQDILNYSNYTRDGRCQHADGYQRARPCGGRNGAGRCVKPFLFPDACPGFFVSRPAIYWQEFRRRRQIIYPSMPHKHLSMILANSGRPYR